MHLDFEGNVQTKGRTIMQTGENKTSRVDVLQSLTGVISILQAMKESETNTLFQKLAGDFPKEGIDFHETRKQFEISLVRQALRRTRGNQKKAAKLLRMRPTTLNAVMKRTKIGARFE